jgi:hypothetical protein
MTVELGRPKQPLYMRWTIAVLCAWDSGSGLGSQPQTLEPGSEIHKPELVPDKGTSRGDGPTSSLKPQQSIRLCFRGSG